jgi:polysaccharide export outer membrane protein
MSVHTRVLPVITAALISGCTVSPFGETASDKLPANALAPQPAAQPRKDVASLSGPARDHDAIQKVALTVASASDPASKSYKVGPRDVLEVTVFQAPELSKTFQVSERGTINFPLVGEIDAGGRTAREIELDLHKKLGAKYLQNPQISVFVKDHFSQRITIEGAVKKPGVFPIAGGGTLLQALAEAQGFDDTASHVVLLFRQDNGRRLAAKYDVSSIRDGSAEDPQLEAGDVIVVPNSELKEGMSVVLKLVPLATLAPYL